MIGWLKGLSEWWEPTAQLTETDISPHFWPNGTMPSSAEYDQLVGEQFARYRLRVGGLVENPREFSLAGLKPLRKQEQITTYFCIQGWSGVAKWGGVPMHEILDIVSRCRRHAMPSSIRLRMAQTEAAITTSMRYSACGTD